MPEIAKFVNSAAANVTPAIAEKVLRQLPQWKLEFTQINAPKFPHLVDQLEFLADAVEDTIEGVYKDLPYGRNRASCYGSPGEDRRGRGRCRGSHRDRRAIGPSGIESHGAPQNAGGEMVAGTGWSWFSRL